MPPPQPPPTPVPSTLSTATTLTTPSATTKPSFTYPLAHTFPPFFTLQPNLQTRTCQLRKWSRLIQRYCAYHRLFKLSLLPALEESPLFKNATIRKRLSVADAVQVVEWMTREEGGRRAEWVHDGEGKGVRKEAVAWVFWKRPEEWAEVIAGWVEETGQKNTVLTLYELVNGEMTVGQDFHGMDAELFQRSLGLLVKRGKAQVFGSEDQQGVKFF